MSGSKTKTNNMSENLEQKDAIIKDAAVKAAELNASAINEVKSSTEGLAKEMEAKSTETNDKLSLMQKSVDELATSIEKKAAEAKAPHVSQFKSQLDENIEEIKSMGANQNVTFEVKDASNFTPADGPARNVYRDMQTGMIYHDPNHPNRLRNFIPTLNVSSEGGVNYNEETALANPADSKAKGAVPTDTTLTLTKRHQPIETLIATFSIPKEWLNDTAMIESYLSSRFLGNLMDEEDAQILDGSGTSPDFRGINTSAPAANTLTTAGAADTYFTAEWDNAIQNPNRFDVLTAVAAVQADNNWTPDLVFISPSDYYRMSTIKATTDEYVLGQTLVNGVVETFWNGMRVIKTPAQAVGTFTLLDSKTVAYAIREGASFEFGYSGDDFKRNNVSVKAIVRGGLLAYTPNGIVTGLFSVCQTAIASA